jgi:iron-sulfur cluster repair protein YtfE (RIC family)
MHALELLKSDHQKVSELFAQAEASQSEGNRGQIFEKIKTELETHTHIEETVFYPRLEQEEDLKDMVAEAYEEHSEVKNLLREIEALSGDSSEFDAKLKELQENVEHHVEEEEEEMFPVVEQNFDASALKELGKQMETAKKEYSKQQSSSSSARTSK